nr:DUF177 domain-containing protein [Tianweitania sediminis]
MPSKGMPVLVEADAAMRTALAQAHGLLSVERFKADLLVTDWKGNGVAVRGRVEAEITQACIASLEPVPARIDEPVDATFLPRNSKLFRLGDLSGEVLVDPEGPDAPEILEGDTLDVGALAEEFFGVAINPYPRKSDAVPVAPQADADKPLGPLAEKLAALKAKT